MIINAGSGPVRGGTYEEAERRAKEWLARMRKDHIVEVDLELPGAPTGDNDGRWQFTFKHRVTGKTATLAMHGLVEEQEERLIFAPRIYWNGGSSSNPDLVRDFLTDEYEVVLRRKSEVAS